MRAIKYALKIKFLIRQLAVFILFHYAIIILLYPSFI